MYGVGRSLAFGIASREDASYHRGKKGFEMHRMDE